MSEADSGPETDNAGDETVVEEQAPTTEQMSLDDALTNALTASEQSDADPEDAEPEEGDAPDDADDQDDDEGEPDDTATEENAAEEAEPEEAEDGEPEEALSAPDHWPADKREAFDGLPNEAKQVLLDQSKALEAQFTRKNQDLSEQTKFAEEVHQLAAPYREQLQMQGMTEIDGIRQLVGLNDYYQRDPVGYIKYVAQAANVDLASLTQQPADGTDDYADPQVAALTQKVQSLEAASQQQVYSQQQQVAQQANGMIQQFASETDANGQPLRPYFEQVKPLMGALLETKQASSLEDAYDKAINADPTIRQQITAAQQAKASQEEDAKRQAAVEKAKRAKRAPKSTAPPVTKPVSTDLDSIINAAQAQYS